jgi:hypothetical protein
MTSQFDFNDRQAPPTNMTMGNNNLQKSEDALSNLWHLFIQHDTKYWQYHDLNNRFLPIHAERGSQDIFLLLPLIANLLLDFLLFHNLADYFIRLLIPNTQPWMVITAACLFPLCYMAIEFKFAHLIHAAKLEKRNYPFDGWLTFWIVWWYILGFCWAVLPGAVFAYIMTLAQADSQLSWILISILTVLGILLHLLIVFGGEPVIEAKNRWYARWQEKGLGAIRLKAHRHLGKEARRTKGIASHYAQVAIEQKMVPYFLGLSGEAIFIIKFVDQGYYALHPLDRPMEYRYSIYRTQTSAGALPENP